MPPNSRPNDPQSSDEPHSEPKCRKRFWRPRRILIAAVIGLLIGPYILSRAMSPLRAVRQYSVDVSANKPALRPDPRTLRVCCFNIAHGRGPAQGNTKGGSRTERQDRLRHIADLLDRIDADIVVLNEVDFESTWSNGVNQAKFLAETAGYEFVAEQRNLDFRVATATWRFGNAILSRHPITASELVELPALKTWEALLAGKKKSLLCQIDIHGQTVHVGAIHLSHRSESLRVSSARTLLKHTKRTAEPIILAGDFNSTPPEFPGSIRSPVGENAMEVFDKSSLFHRLPQTPRTEREFTFRSDAPIRTIDWILASTDCSFREYETIHVKLSDHRPVVAVIQLP